MIQITNNNKIHHPPSISVVIPVFNVEPFLPLFIQSLREQTHKNFEALFIDDGSTDNSAKIIESEAANDSRLTLYQQSNSGPSVARNTGLALAKGQWVLFLDSDDFLPHNALEIMLNTAQIHSPEVVITNAFRFSTSPNQVTEPEVLKHQPWGECVSGPEWIVRTASSGNWKHYIWSHLYRRTFLENHRIQFEPGLIHEDILWTCDVAMKASNIAFNNQITYGYRINPNSLIGSNDQKRTHHRIESYTKVITKLLNTGDSLPSGALKLALYKQAVTEAGHMMGLLRKRLNPSEESRTLAVKFLETGTFKRLLKSSRAPDDLWRMFRLKHALKTHAAGYRNRLS